MDDHMRSLGQKYMGIRPSKHEELFQDTSIKPDGGHDVLVDNFLNAQCMYCQARARFGTNVDGRLLGDHYWHAATVLQGSPGYGQLQLVGAIVGV